MNIAVIFAGGVGTRMRSKDCPKQFLEIYGKPIIIHTLDIFQQNQNIDAIVIACVEEWIPYLKELIEKFKIVKVKKIVPGGETGQLSIYNGLLAAKDVCGNSNTIVLIHDAVRPLINSELIDRNIESVKTYGSAITAGVVKETIVVVDDNFNILTVPERAHSRVAKAPQSFYLKDIMDAHQKAISQGIRDSIDSCTLMKYYGYEMTMVDGPYNNIKITTLEDFFTMRAIYESNENLQFYLDNE